MKTSPILLLICLTLALLGSAEAQTDSTRPNILLIVGDDIGFGDLGISGSVTRTSSSASAAAWVVPAVSGICFTLAVAGSVCALSSSTSSPSFA
jgi:arylsulfatase